MIFPSLFVFVSLPVGGEVISRLLIVLSNFYLPIIVSLPVGGEVISRPITVSIVIHIFSSIPTCWWGGYFETVLLVFARFSF